MRPSNKDKRLFKKNIFRDIFWDSAQSKNMWKIQTQRQSANFSDKNLWKYFDYVNKCSLNEYDLKMYFQASITNNEKWVIPKLFFA